MQGEGTTLKIIQDALVERHGVRLSMGGPHGILTE
jgi:hypothetical protein